MIPSMMGTTSYITMQSLGKIVQRAPAVGAKMWCLFFLLPAGCREAANCRYCFTHRPKNRFFAPQGRLVAPIHTKLGRNDVHVGPLCCAIFHLNRPRGVGMRPQNIKNFHFLVKSRPLGATPLTHFQNFRDFYTPNYPTSVLQISCDSLHRLRSYC